MTDQVSQERERQAVIRAANFIDAKAKTGHAEAREGAEKIRSAAADAGLPSSSVTAAAIAAAAAVATAPPVVSGIIAAIISVVLAILALAAHIGIDLRGNAVTASSDTSATMTTFGKWHSRLEPKYGSTAGEIRRSAGTASGSARIAPLLAPETTGK